MDLDFLQSKYQEWSDFYESKITEWMTLQEIKESIGLLSAPNAPSPELLLVHAMKLLEDEQ